MTKRKIEDWVMPPDQDAEFVACMEEVLETYAAAYDPRNPVLCMDEQPVQLLKETRVPIAATPQHGTRVDDAYERTGTASIFHIPSYLVVEDTTTHRKPPEVRICRLRNQSAVGNRPPSTSTPHCP